MTHAYRIRRVQVAKDIWLPVRAELIGQRCKVILTRGSRVPVEFAGGELVVTSRWAVRRVR